jgi:hypothetical protein
MNPADWQAIEALISGQAPTGAMVFSALRGISWAVGQTVQDNADPLPVQPARASVTFDQVLRAKAIGACQKMAAGQADAALMPGMTWPHWAATVLAVLQSQLHFPNILTP